MSSTPHSGFERFRKWLRIFQLESEVRARTPRFPPPISLMMLVSASYRRRVLTQFAAMLHFIARVDRRPGAQELAVIEWIMTRVLRLQTRAKREFLAAFRAPAGDPASLRLSVEELRRMTHGSRGVARVLVECLVAVALGDDKIARSELLIIEEVLQHLGLTLADYERRKSNCLTLRRLEAELVDAYAEAGYVPLHEERRRRAEAAERLREEFRSDQDGRQSSEHRRAGEQFVQARTPELEDYALFGVSPAVSDDELRKVYRKLVRMYHPDVLPSDISAEARDLYTSRFREIQEAYDRIVQSRRRDGAD